MTLLENPTHVDRSTERVLAVLSPRRRRLVAEDLLGADPGDGDPTSLLAQQQHGALIALLTLSELKELCLLLGVDASGQDLIRLQNEVMTALEFKASDEDIRERSRQLQDERAETHVRLEKRGRELRIEGIIFVAVLVFVITLIMRWDPIASVIRSAFGAVATWAILRHRLGPLQGVMILGMGLILLDMIVFGETFRWIEWMFFAGIGGVMGIHAESLDEKVGMRLPKLKDVFGRKK